MSLTGNEITAGATYAVRIDKKALSFKRGNDAVALVKGVNGQVEDLVYDPQNPAANPRTGYVRLENPQPAVSKYDPATQTWAVTVPAGSIRVLESLRTLAGHYDAYVTEGAPDAPAAPAKPARPASRIAWKDVEGGDGFTNEERAGWRR